MSSSPQQSLNCTFGGWADTQAAYRFFNNGQVSAAALIDAHQEQTVLRIAGQDRLLLAQDTTELDYTANFTLQGAGPISQNKSSKRTGFFLHAHYLMDRNHVPLGVWGMDFETRDIEQSGQSEARKKLPIEEKGSYRWLLGYRRACALQDRFPDTQVVSLADRESDIFEIYSEHFQRIRNGEKAAEFIIRAKENRALLNDDPDEGKRPGTTSHLFDEDTRHPVIGEITFDVPTRMRCLRIKDVKTRYERKARRVTQEIRAYQITPRPPQRRGEKLPQLKLWVVSAKETNAPEGEPPIEWVLLTSMEAGSLSQAGGIIKDYLGRWPIELFFRTLKTGCRIEKLRLKKATALQNGIALYGIVAWRLNFLAEHVRINGEESCETYFAEEEWQSTLAVTGKRSEQKETPSLREFMMIVAELGGYLGRESDPPPGAQPIWQGLQKVFNYSEAWLAFQNRES